VSGPSLVVSCTSPASAGEPELERWLTEKIATLGPGRASVYGPLPENGNPAGNWLVFIYESGASDPQEMADLLTEMRLLGLRPTVYGSTNPRLIA